MSYYEGNLKRKALKQSLMCKVDDFGGVYVIANKLNNKQYIGCSTTIRQRIRSHILCLKRNQHPNEEMQGDFNNHGVCVFDIKILKRSKLPYNSLCGIEAQYIKEHQPFYNQRYK